MRLKTDRFNPGEAQLARYCKALGHPARLRILSLLALREDSHCAPIVEKLPLAQATISQHIAELVDAGLIVSSPRGTCSRLALDAQGLLHLARLFEEFSRSLNVAPGPRTLPLDSKKVRRS